MKIFFFIFCQLAAVISIGAQTCTSCGTASSSGSSGNDVGPSFNASLGSTQYGESAGHLFFNANFPDPNLFTPVALQLDALSRINIDVIVLTTNVIQAKLVTEVETDAIISTNPVVYINAYAGGYITNQLISADDGPVTNVSTVYVTNTIIMQVQAPQAIADIPWPPPTTNGYVINFYLPSEVTGQLNGLDQFSGQQPFISWMITNSNPSTIDQLQITETNLACGSIKQWNYTYNTATASWSVQTLAGVVENMVTTSLNATSYQIKDTFQYVGGPIVQQTATTYTNLSWGAVAPFAVVAGAGDSQEITTYTYYDRSPSGNLALPKTVTHPDGSSEYYASYDGNGNPTDVYSTFEDDSNGRETQYYYDPGYVYGSGDDGSANPNMPRETIVYVNGQPVSQEYTAFPSASERLDIQCTSLYNSGWSDPNNLVTTNFFYASGAYQYDLQAVIRPDGTATTYNYLTNADGSYQTNITVTGQPSSCSANAVIVDGVSNVTVLNSAGYNVFAASYDVKTGIALSQDTYSGFDNFGRPTQVMHLDGTTEATQYACCGLASTTDRDGLVTTYQYDAGQRQIGNAKYVTGFGTGNPIIYTNALDAASRLVQSVRVGTDGTPITMSQSAYDLAGELIAQTNALNGATKYTRSNDPNTGGLIRTTTNPDGGTITNIYYADGSLRKTVGSGVHGKAYGYGAEYVSALNCYCTYTVVTNLNADGSPTAEWTKTYTDMAGRQTEVQYADSSYSQSSYNAKGQLWKQVDPDNVTNLYGYNAKGELTTNAIDMNGNGMIDSGVSDHDRITQTINDVFNSWRRTRTYIWLDGQSTGTLVSEMDVSLNGLSVLQTQYRDASTPLTTETDTYYGSSSRQVDTWAPDGSFTEVDYSYGRLVSRTPYDSTWSPIGGTIYGYDAQGRQNTVTDARNGTTIYGYNNADLVNSVTTPSPGNSGSPQTTTTYYNSMEQATSVTQADGTVVYSSYLPTGEMGLQDGARTYPVGYGYDYAGRMQTMTNWSGFSGGTGTGARVTTWKYNGYRGWLTNKVYDDGHGPSYTYTDAGKLKTRTWARNLTTTYAYDSADDLQKVLYSDGTTPNVTNSYDRLGRLTTNVCSGITDMLVYNLANQLISESYSGGILNGLSVTNGYNQYLRRTALAGLNGTTPLVQQSFAYNASSWLQTVSDGNGNSAAYSYVANSLLVSQITFKQSTTTRMTATKQYDDLDRLTSISSQPSASGVEPISFSYGYNSANQRTKDALADGSYWIYGYDSLGQVTSACKYWRDGTPVAGQQFDYAFDSIGNRTQTQSGGDATGANLRPANYYANNLNQLTNRVVPGNVDIKGVSIATNTVMVNADTAYRKAEYFRDELTVTNTDSALWTNIIVTATGQASVTGNVYVAQTPEVFKYDADGNLTNDGRFSWTWDAENRLTDLTSLTTAPQGSKVKLDFAYDPQGRRIQKIVSTNNGSAYVAEYTNRFLYDGWNLIAELNPSTALVRSYMWGSDLSGSMQGAGGVGGLLEVVNYGVATNFVAYDGNGNVVALVNATDGTVSGNLEYGPFGEPIRLTGTAKAAPFRFSTKYDDDECDLLYYGYRYYKPSTGTWPNHDPLDDYAFFKNSIRGLDKKLVKQLKAESLMPTYGFVRNDPINKCDTDGRTSILLPIIGGGIVVGTGVALWCWDHLENIREQATTDANAEMAKLDPNYDPTLDGPDHEGSVADALRHCIGACMANQHPCCVGSAITRRLIQNRENAPGIEHDQDRANNVVGFGITGNCVQSCINALNSGQLSCFNTGDTSLSPCKSPKKN